jgi:hypothetical protein
MNGFDCSNRRKIQSLIRRWKNDPNFIEALMIEYPERVQGAELIDCYPRKIDMTYWIIDNFVNSLYWRDKKNFNKRTVQIVRWLLGHSENRRKILNVLFGLSCRPNHPFGSARLHNYLLSLSLIERDLIWSEFIRKSYGESSVHKLILWLTEERVSHLSDTYIDNYILLLQWALCSTIHSLRDRATKSLFLLGKRRPETLFELTKNSFKIDDLYIRERMLASLTGIFLALHTSSDLGQRKYIVSDLLPRASKWLHTNVIVPTGQFATTHVTIRDYSLVILELALKYGHLPQKQVIDAFSWKQIPHLAINRGTLWFRDRETLTERKGDGDAIWGHSPYVHMDSAKYILGPRSYDDNGKSLVRDSLAKVVWKIKRIGWNE